MLGYSKALSDVDANTAILLLMFRKAKDVVKAIKKRLGNKNPNTQLYAVMVSTMTLL
jgi:hypothetical protein